MPKTMMTTMMMMMMIMTDPFATILVVKGPVAKGSVVKGATSYTTPHHDDDHHDHLISNGYHDTKFFNKPLLKIILCSS